VTVSRVVATEATPRRMPYIGTQGDTDLLMKPVTKTIRRGLREGLGIEEDEDCARACVPHATRP